MKEKKLLSKNMLIRSIVLAAIVVALAAFNIATNAISAQKSAAIQDAANSSTRGEYLKDGTFQGSAKGYGGITTVEVTVENGFITNVDIVSCMDDSPYIDNVVASLIPDLIAEQTTTVDVVTNASYSSNGVRFAVRDALRNAGAMPDSENAKIAAQPTGVQSETDKLSIGYLMNKQEKQKVASNASGVAGGK